MYWDVDFVAKEWARQSIPGKLVPTINPSDLRGNFIGKKTWRALLECGLHNANCSGFYIWHADRNIAWDASEGWFQATLEFIEDNGLTTAPDVR